MAQDDLSVNGQKVTAINPLPATYESGKATYSYQGVDIGPAATATDVVQLVGSATKILRINRVKVTIDATAASVLDFYLFKRTAANTGGTATQPAICKLDSNDIASTGVINLYSANPSAIGAGVLLSAEHYALPAAATTGYPAQPWIEDFGTRNSKQLFLRGVAESLCIGFNGGTIPAGTSLYVRIEWTEE